MVSNRGLIATFLSNEETFLPNEATFASNEATFASNEATFASNEATFAPNEATFAPNEATTQLSPNQNKKEPLLCEATFSALKEYTFVIPQSDVFLHNKKKGFMGCSHDCLFLCELFTRQLLDSVVGWEVL